MSTCKLSKKFLVFIEGLRAGFTPYKLIPSAVAVVDCVVSVRIGVNVFPVSTVIFLIVPPLAYAEKMTGSIVVLFMFSLLFTSIS